MKKIVIIGAGAMGSAFTVPCFDNKHETYLVGSFLEDKVIEQINEKNNFHPVLKCQLPKNIKVKKYSEFNEEIKKNIDLFVIGVSSKGIEWAGKELSKFYQNQTDVLLLTKGLAVIENKFETLGPTFPLQFGNKTEFVRERWAQRSVKKSNYKIK